MALLEPSLQHFALNLFVASEVQDSFDESGRVSRLRILIHMSFVTAYLVTASYLRRTLQLVKAFTEVARI